MSTGEIDWSEFAWLLALLVPVAAFVLPILARSWTWLFILGAVGLAPALLLAGLGLDAKDTIERGFSFAFAIFVAIPALAGIAARALTLRLAARGMGRPGTLWIEGFAVVVAVGAIAALIGAV